MKNSRHIKYLNIRFFAILCIAFLSQGIHAQEAPMGINYQAALRNTTGAPIADSTLVLSVWIRQNSTNGDVVYTEDHQVTTNGIGLFNLVIGHGESNDDFTRIPWNKGPFFLELQLNGRSFSITQLYSVPYALHAGSASKLTDLDTPVLPSDPTPKQYVDSLIGDVKNSAISLDDLQEKLVQEMDSLASENYVQEKISQATEGVATEDFVTELLRNAKGIDLSANGDTLFAEGVPIIIPGINSQNTHLDITQRCIGGSEDDLIKVFFKTEKNTYIIGAESNSRNGDMSSNKGASDMFITEIDSNLQTLWQTSLGGSQYDHITHILPYNENEFLIGGTTESNSGDISGNHGNYDVFLAILDKEHHIRWSKCFGGSNADFLNQIHVYDDGSVLLGATTFSADQDIATNYGNADIWLLKLNPLQELEWKSTYGSLRYESLHSFIIKDEQIIVLGETESNSGMVLGNSGGLDFWIVLLDKNGSVLKQRCIGSAQNEELNVVKLHNNTLFLGGTTFSTTWDAASSITKRNIWISKVSTDLSTVSSNNYGGNGAELIQDIFIADDKRLTLACSSSSYEGDVTQTFGDNDFWIATIGNDLSLDAQQNFGGSYSDELRVAKKTTDGYVFAGISESNDHDVIYNNGESDIWVVKTDHEFNIIASKHYGGSYSENVLDLHLNGNKFIIVGSTQSSDYGILGFHGKPGKQNDVWLIKDSFE